MAQQIDIVANLLMKVDGAEAGINKLKNSLSKLKMPEGLENSFKKSFANLDVIFARYRSQVEKGFNTKADITNFAKTGKALDAELDRISKHFAELTGKQIDFKVNSTEITKTEQELTKLIAQRNELAKNSIKFEISGVKEGYKDIESLLTKLKEVAGNTKTGQYAGDALDFLKKGDLQSALSLLDRASVSCKRLNKDKQDLFSDTGLNMSTAIKKIVDELTGAEGKFGNVNTEVTKLESILADLRTGQIKDAGELAQKLADEMLNTGTAAKQANGAMQDFAQSSFSAAQQLQQLQQSTQYFFSLRNMINLLKRGVREAVDTVKDLDKAMTETAVVTKFSVSDMWKKLPEYTANANALGATVQDMYEATTLYYQQGLNSQQAMEIAAETMKMARIGGLEATVATDMMTAALRGFNMELNELSAQRINDVYSNLAAKTASNTKELGTAMQRTASIAASAGMSFEGTAAFLAQAIETTREPAENLGTAMKTIVARFTELKKNPLEITEVDGEEVDYNKVDTALKSIGVSLKDTNGQFRNLDQVFLDISERWDSLTQTQQRYIATTAAGSRQQSRFIAMMSNYERTTQLMEYANDANGASNEQFGKTLDSLEAKINKFQNAWKEFLMGVMNDSWTKGIVDAGTKVLDIVNKLIDVLSFGGKAKGIKSFLSLFAAFKGLKLAGRGINALIGGLGGALDPKGSFTKGFKTGAIGSGKTEINQATNRIVQAIYSLVPHIDKEASNAAVNRYRFQESGTYNQARKELINSLGGHLGQIKKGQGNYTAGGVLDIINTNQLNKQQQKQFFQASPGLKKNLTKSLTQLYQDVGTDKKTTQALISGFKSGDIGLEEALLGNNKLSTSFGEAYAKLIDEGQIIAAQQLKNKHYGELYQTGLSQGLQGKELEDFVAKNLDSKRILNERGQQFLQNPQILTNSQKFANVAGQIGAGFMSAGSAVQMFGAQVSQINPILGQAISNFGGLLTAAGSVANIIPNIIAGGPVAWGIGAAVAAIGGLAIGLKAHADNVKKKGQEVVDNYKNTADELQSSIDNIKNYQSELSQLSAGVDEKGFNINLDDSEYKRYQELVNDLVQQNPAIVEGWNSEGKAIINVNKALKDTIKLKQQNLNAEKEKYLSDTSGQQLINARNATKEYKKVAGSKSGFTYDASALVGEIISVGLEDEATAAGFDLDKIRQGDLQAIDFLRNHYTLLESIYKQGGLEMSDNVSDLITNLSTNLEAYEQAIAPVVDYLTEYATEEQLFADLPVELTSAFNDGIKSIAGKDLNIGEMKKATNYLGLELRNAFDKAEDPLNRADEALDKFSKDLDEAAYNKAATSIANELRTLKLDAEAVGEVEVAQWYENQASRIENALTNSIESISNYINTLSDDIDNAKAHFDALGEGIDDYYSLADQARGLVDTALEEKNTEGRGSKTFWNTYRGLASEEAYNRHDKAEAIADMEQFQKYFAEGAEGSRAFAQDLINLQNKTFDFTDKNGQIVSKSVKDFFELTEDGTMRVTDAFTDLNDEQYAQLASVFKLSSDGFTTVLNKLRQFGDLSFSDPQGIRRALAFDERSVKTEVKVEVENEKEPVNRLYYGESMLSAEMSDMEPDEQKEIIENLEVQGSIQLPSGAENLINAKIDDGETGSLLKQFVEDTKGTGNQVENVMKALVQSGEYNKDDLELIHTALTEEGGLLAGATDANVGFQDLYDGIIKEIDNPAAAETNDHLSNISSTVDTIAGIVAAGKVKEGYLPEVARQSDNLYKELVGEKGIADTWAQLFSQGKDANGNAITSEGAYRELDKKLNDWATTNNKYLEDLRAGREAAAANGASVETLEAFDNEIAQAEHNASLIALYSQNAADNYERITQGSQRAAENVAYQLQNISEQNLTSDQQKSEVTNSLQNFAKELQNLNFSPEQIAGIFKDNFGIELELKGGEFATDVGDQIQEAVNSKNFDINAALNIQEIKMPGAARGKNNTPSAIRRVGTMARGSKKRGYTIGGEPTLTGELGPELVWEPKQNAAYMVGEHGPQFANLSKNAVVWNAEQTKRIKKNSKGVGFLGTGAYGIHSFGTMAGGNAKKGGLTVPGVFEVNANANIQEIIPPEETPSIPIKPEFKDIKNIDATAIVTKVEKGGYVVGEPISVQATATTTKVVDENPTPQQPSTQTQIINVTANTSAAQARINKLLQLFNKTYTLKYQASGPSSIKVPISANFTGSWKKTVEINRSGARGINNHIRNHIMPQFGSVAKGHYGTIGPKNKGGLTLTGEKGYEIAWLPDENRSMILGADGPQMLDLPNNAVVWTHEQSKKILKQKPIFAGSHGDNSVKGDNIFKYLNVTPTYDNSTTKKDKKGKDTKKDDKKDKDTKKIVAKVGKITVWWENMTRRIEATERLAEKNQKKYEKYLAQMKATLYTTGTKGGGNDYIKNLNHEIALYKKEVNRANAALKKYDKSTKKKDKVSISYTPQGKNKKTNEKVSLSKYISKKDGTYVLNEKALNAITDKNRRKAIKEAATKKVDDYLSKKYKAEDGIAKAKEELEKFGEQLYETFFAWEISLNEIWDLTQRIEAAQGKITRTDTMSNLLDAQISSGLLKADENTAASGLELFKQRLEEQNNIVAERSVAIKEAQDAVQNAYSTDDEQKQLDVIQKKLQKDNAARQQRQEAKKRVDKAKEKLANKKKLQEQKKDLQKELKQAKGKKERDKIQKKINAINKKLKNYGTDKALKDAIAAAQKTYDTVKEQTKGQLLSATQKAGYKEAEEQIKARQEAIAKSQKYGSFTRNADGTFSVDFNTEQLEKDKLAGLISEEQAKFIEEYYTNLIEASKDLDETINSLGEDVIEYYTSLSDLRDEWVNYEDELIQMTEETNRKQIDNLKKLSDSVKQALDDLINDVKRKLDERRKQEENAKTEQDISRKQQRLAALRADTSGGHQVEIAQLEKEIAEAQQNYQNSLEDQLLERLQAQNDEAAKQRERQISLQEELINSVNNIQQVNEWMANPTAPGVKEQMLLAYRQTHDYDKKGIYGQERIDENFETFYQGLITNQDKQEELRQSIEDLTAVMKRLKVLQEQSGKTPAELASELAKEDVDAKTMHDTYGLSYSTIKEHAGYNAEKFAADGVDYKGAKEAFTVAELRDVDEYSEEAKTDYASIKKSYQNFVKNRGDKDSISTYKGKIGAAGLKAQLERGRQLGYSDAKVFADLATTSGLTWEKVITAAKEIDYTVNQLLAMRNSSDWNSERKNSFGKAVNKVYKLPKKNSKGVVIQKALKTNFLTGGLADFTGPAWLDGTPSKPELVLNAKDTQNFIALKDVLANAMNGMGDTSNTYGDILYEININVDKIEKDYDVDRVVKKVKEEITKGAGYRNVTQVRNFR